MTEVQSCLINNFSKYLMNYLLIQWHSTSASKARGACLVKSKNRCQFKRWKWKHFVRKLISFKSSFKLMWSCWILSLEARLMLLHYDPNEMYMGPVFWVCACVLLTMSWACQVKSPAAVFWLFVHAYCR